MSSRAALDKQGRRTLLEQLAAKRQQRAQQPAGAVYESLEDSEDEGSADESFATARSKQRPFIDDSDDDENQRPGIATSRPAAAGAASKLNRLRRAGDPPVQHQQRAGVVAALEDGSDDDIAAQLGGLSIKAKPRSEAQRGSGLGGGGAGLGAPAERPAQPRPDLGRQHHREADKQASAEPDGRRMILGERGEFQLNAKASQMLYPHQVEGVKWLWSLYSLQRGGILADDMGLGKTIQCAAFLAGLIENRLIRRAVVVAPKTLLAQWRKELGICGLKSQTHEYGGTAAERETALERVVRRRGVLLTTYGMVLHNAEVLAAHDEHDADDGPMWDVMICDEGHKLKNPRMQLRKQLDEVPVGLRIIISGTPIQNNLMEMWALFNFCTPDVLGDAPDFRDRYEKVITHGSDKHATEYERERGAVAAARLRQEIGPYMLRREKKEVFKSTENTAPGAAAGTAGGSGDDQATAASSGGITGGAKPSAMPHKNDLIVWLKLKPMQRKVYQAFLNSDSVKKVFNQTSSALAAITVLKKVCDHPALLSDRAANGIVSGVNRARRQAEARLAGGGGDSDVEEIEDSSDDDAELVDSEEGDWESGSEDCSSEDEQLQRRRQAQKAKSSASRPAPAAGLGAEGDEGWNIWASADIEQKLLDEVHTTGFGASCKTVFVMALLKSLVPEGHRTLIFSQSRVMLNILEAAIKEERWRYCRIDGSVASAADREARVNQFQTSTSIPIFLLTSQVGGLGLTLTAADRVIILDPAWNPSTDNQSVDRAYRIGQKRDVVVYRLISCGTVEEKIYRRQVFKGGLSRTGMEEGEQFRYFAQEDLRDLFRLEPSECESSRTQRELHDMHALQRRETPALRDHLHFLRTLPCYAGVSDHDLLFSKKEKEAPPTVARPQPSFGGGSAAAGASGRGGAAAGSARPGSVFGKTAAQGWSGGSELSDAFSRALNISGGSSGAAAVAAAAQPPGSSVFGGGGSSSGAHPSTSASKSPREAKQERIDDLEDQLERKRHLLSLAAGLADGGARIRSQISELEQQLAEAQRDESPASDSSTASGAAALPSAVVTFVKPAPAKSPAFALPLPGAPALAVSAAAALPGSSRDMPGAPAAASAAAGAGAGIAQVGARTRPEANSPTAAPPAAKPAAASLIAAAAAVPLPAGQAAPIVGARQLAAAQPAAPPQPPPAAPVAAAPAPAASTPSRKPALLARLMGGMSSVWSSSKKAPPAAAASSRSPSQESEPASYGSAASGRSLSFGSPMGSGQQQAAAGPQRGAGGQQQAAAAVAQRSSASVIDLSEDDPPAASWAPHQLAAGRPPAGLHTGNSGSFGGGAAARAEAAAPAAGSSGSDGSQAAKPPRSVSELKSRLMETLQAIKTEESRGLFEREKVEKLRRRAGRLQQQYEEAKKSRAIKVAGSASPLAGLSVQASMHTSGSKSAMLQ